MRAEAPKRKPHIQNQINYFKSWGSLYLAEREGFEPSCMRHQQENQLKQKVNSSNLIPNVPVDCTYLCKLLSHVLKNSWEIEMIVVFL